MTVEEFKQDNPHLSHLEGDALWDAMERHWIIKYGHKPPEGILNVETVKIGGYTISFHMSKNWI
jgi:hypothetical protein